MFSGNFRNAAISSGNLKKKEAVSNTISVRFSKIMIDDTPGRFSFAAPRHYGNPQDAIELIIVI
jgi:hypothetical protein